MLETAKMNKILTKVLLSRNFEKKRTLINQEFTKQWMIRQKNTTVDLLFQNQAKYSTIKALELH